MSKMLYDNDEPPCVPRTDSVSESKSKSKRRSAMASKTKITSVCKQIAPLEETKFRVLLEVEGNRSNEDEPGVDIVVVLDVSGSTADGGRLNKMKSATKFLIDILTEKHRLSVVSFSSTASLICPLRCMTGEAKGEIEDLVNALMPGGGTNIADGLKLSLRILEERKYSRGRVPAVILMSDGDQGRRFDDAREVQMNQVSVFTIGLGNGNEYNPEVLNTIAKKSKGGTFSIVDIQNEDSNESNNLNTAFALCLGWLLSVVVLDLQMTISAVQSSIENHGVPREYYPIVTDNYSTTIQLGHLCGGEKRSFLVDLELPKVANEGEYKVLEITYTYIYDGEPFNCNPISVTVLRRPESLDEEKTEIEIENKRIETLGKMKKAIEFADGGNFDEAKNELEQARNSLDGLDYTIIEALKSQLKQLIELMEPNLYRSKGHHIALSILTSHYRRREAITNDDLKKSNLFDTDATFTFAQNVKSHIADKNEESSEKILKLVEYFQALLEAPKTKE